MGFPCGSAGKEPACNAGDLGSIPGLGRSPRKGKGYPFQYSGLENSMDCINCGVTKSQTQLSSFHFHFSVKLGFKSRSDYIQGWDFCFIRSIFQRAQKEEKTPMVTQAHVTQLQQTNLLSILSHLSPLPILCWSILKQTSDARSSHPTCTCASAKGPLITILLLLQHHFDSLTKLGMTQNVLQHGKCQKECKQFKDSQEVTLNGILKS